MNDGDSYTTRQSLMGEIARGGPRLEGKRVVVYEFAAQELAAGDWKVIRMSAAAGRQVPAPEAQMLATALVSSIARVPDPRSTPYDDCIIAVHLTDIRAEGHAPPVDHREILGYV